MQVFQRERDLGLGQAVLSSSSVVYASVARPTTPVPPLPDAAGRRGEHSPCPDHGRVASALDLSLDDLFPIESVLVSTGPNLNDDWFDRDETYAARRTPEDKPLNHEHESIKTIGHMTAARVVDRDLNPVADGDEVPDAFHVVNSAVLYRHWPGYPDRQEMVDAVIAELQDPPGRPWCVSMECRFAGFDYMLVPLEDNGPAFAKAKQVTRNESTAYLTKHLRAYGGTGVFQGHRVYRVLKNITFSGVGLVRQPANPDSVVLRAGDEPGLGVASEKISEFPGGPGYDPLSTDATEMQMTVEVLTKQVEDLKAQLADANQSKAAEAAKKVAELEASLAAAKAELDAATKGLGEAQSELAKVAGEKAAADKVIAALTERAEKAECELKARDEEAAKAAAERAKAERTRKVKAAYGLETDEDAAKAAEPLFGLTDEAFEKHLEALASYKAKTKATDGQKADAAAKALDQAKTKTGDDAAVVVVDAEKTEAARKQKLADEMLGYFCPAKPDTKSK